MGKNKRPKARPARLDPKGTDKPLTTITPVVAPGKLNLPGNETGYVYRPTNPHTEDK